MQVVGHKSTRRSAEEWLVFLRKASVSLACLLLAGASVCWVAANWEQATRFQKLAGTQLALLVIVGVVCWQMCRAHFPLRKNTGLSGLLIALAAILVGVNLALVGQIYHTGADRWQLFLLWLALLLPWLVALPGPALVLFSACLANVAMALFLDDKSGLWWPAKVPAWPLTALSLAFLNGLMLIAAESFRDAFEDRWRIVPRAIAAIGLCWVVASAFDVFDGESGAAAWLPALFAALGAAAFYGRPARRDLIIVSLAMLSAFLVLFVVLISLADGEAALFAVTAILLAFAGLGLRHLRRLTRAAPGENEADLPADPDDPWYVGLFRMSVMGLAAILITALLLMVLEPETWALWPLGLAFSAPALALYLWSKNRSVREFSMTLVTAGLILGCVGIHSHEEMNAGLRIGFVLCWGAVLYYLVTNAAMRTGIAFLVLAAALITGWPDRSSMTALALPSSEAVWRYLPAYGRLWWLAVAAVLAWTVKTGRDGEPWRPLAWALVFLVQVLAWFAPAPALFKLGQAWQQAPALILIWVACAVLPVVVLGALLARVPGLALSVRILVPGMLAIASLGWMGVPGVGMAVLWLILGFALRQARLVGFAILALLAYMGWFYYQLEATLLHKSMVLAGTGGWMLLTGYVLKRRAAVPASEILPPPLAVQENSAEGPQLSRPKRYITGWRVGALALGLAAVLVVVNTGVYRYEQVLTRGTPVVLVLAPVDPRSLMQGDYMSLRYEVGDQAEGIMRNAASDDEVARRRSGYLLLKADATGVHRLVGLAGTREQALAASSDAILPFEWRHGEVGILTNAWFFPEGQGGRYEKARYGEFRVGRDGSSLLLRLLDEARQPVP